MWRGEGEGGLGGDGGRGRLLGRGGFGGGGDKAKDSEAAAWKRARSHGLEEGPLASWCTRVLCGSAPLAGAAASAAESFDGLR